jgi:hypothetical protein
MTLLNSLTCRDCGGSYFCGEVPDSGNFLVLICVDCRKPVLFSSAEEMLCDFGNSSLRLENDSCT